MSTDYRESETVVRELNAIASQVFQLRLLDKQQKAERKLQNIQIVELKAQLARLQESILAKLRSRPLARRWWQRFFNALFGRWKLMGGDYREWSRFYVNAVLLQLSINLFELRWIADDNWYKESGLDANYILFVRQHVHKARKLIHRRRVRLTRVCYHTIAIAFRTWADELSPAATKASGWLGVAPGISRELRFFYNHYRTREFWAATWDYPAQAGAGEPRWRAGLRLAIWSGIRYLYGLVSGYGFRGKRYVWSTFIVLSVFAALHWIIDLLGNCIPLSLSPQQIVDYFFSSLADFTSLGAAITANCTPVNHLVAYLATLESLAGYGMLGLLASVLWALIMQTSTDVSGVRLLDSEFPQETHTASPQDFQITGSGED